MMKTIVLLSVGVALAASHAGARRRIQERGGRLNALIDEARPAAKIMLDSSSERRTVIDTCRISEPTLFKLIAFKYGDWAKEPHRDDDVIADIGDVGVVDRLLALKCDHVPFDEYWQQECAEDCRLEWSWLADELARVRVRAGTQGVLIAPL